MRLWQWYRDGRPIKGTLGNTTYVMTEQDVDKEISVGKRKVRHPRKKKKRIKHLIRRAYLTGETITLK